MLRLQGLGAMVVALAPLLAWAAWRFARRRHLPRPTAVIAFLAPLVMVIAIQDLVLQDQSETAEFERWTNARGRFHGHTAYEGLDHRAPDLVTGAGWTLDEYRDFSNWLIIDEDDYPAEKLERLIATGGVPEVITPQWGYRQLRGIYEDSAASVALFLTLVIGGVLLALLGVIDRARGVAFCLGYLAFVIGVALWMSANYRFPQ